MDVDDRITILKRRGIPGVPVSSAGLDVDDRVHIRMIGGRKPVALPISDGTVSQRVILVPQGRSSYIPIAHEGCPGIMGSASMFYYNYGNPREWHPYDPEVGDWTGINNIFLMHTGYNYCTYPPQTWMDMPWSKQGCSFKADVVDCLSGALFYYIWQGNPLRVEFDWKLIHKIGTHNIMSARILYNTGDPYENKQTNAFWTYGMPPDEEWHHLIWDVSANPPTTIYWYLHFSTGNYPGFWHDTCETWFKNLVITPRP